MTTITKSDMATLLANITTLNQVAAGTGLTTPGGVKTLRGVLSSLGYTVPVVYAGGIVNGVADGNKTVERAGITYAPVLSALPFTTSGTWVGGDDALYRTIAMDAAGVANAVDVQFVQKRYRYHSSAASSSHAAATAGFVIAGTFFDGACTKGSACLFVYEGTTTPSKAGNWPDADGAFYDADGKRFLADLPRFGAEVFGAVGDGVADDTPAIDSALAMSRVVYLTAGRTYKTSSTIGLLYRTLKSDGGIISEGIPVIQPTAAVTGCAIDLNSYGALEGVYVDGVHSTAGVEGVVVTGNITKIDFCTVTRFTTGVEVGEAVSTFCTGLRCIENGTGLRVRGLTGSFPTLTTFRDCQFFRNTGVGAHTERAHQLKFYNCLFEENGDEGLFMDCLDIITSVEVHGCFFEDNEAPYQLRMRTAGGADTVDHVSVKDCFFYGPAKAALFSRVVSITFEGNNIPAVAGTVLFEVNTFGVIRSQFDDVENGFIVIDSSSTVATDPLEGDFIPSIEGNAVAGAGTYPERSGWYSRVGRTVTITINLSWNTHTGSGTGIRVGNLPFVSSATQRGFALSGMVSNIALTAGSVFTGGLVRTSAIQADLFQAPAGGGPAALIPFDTAGVVRLTGTYVVD